MKRALHAPYKSGKLSKDQFKTTVKKVVEQFQDDTQANNDQEVVLPNGDGLAESAKSRLKTLIDDAYRAVRLKNDAQGSSTDANNHKRRRLEQNSASTQVEEAH